VHFRHLFISIGLGNDSAPLNLTGIHAHHPAQSAAGDAPVA